MLALESWCVSSPDWQARYLENLEREARRAAMDHINRPSPWAAPGRTWAALNSRRDPRGQDGILDRLKTLGIAHWFPLIRGEGKTPLAKLSKKQRKMRLIKSTVQPLLPRMTLVHCIGAFESQRHKIDEIPDVLGWVSMNGSPALIADAEIERLRAREEEGVIVTLPPSERTFVLGEAVRITDGDCPFTTLNGIVEEVPPPDLQALDPTMAIKLGIEMMGRRVSIMLELWQIEKL